VSKEKFISLEYSPRN